MKRSELSGKLLAFFHEKEMDGLLGFLTKAGTLCKKEGYYFLASHQPSFSEEQEDQLQQCLNKIKDAGFQPLRRTALLETLEIEHKAGVLILKQATHKKQLIQVAEDLFYTPEQLESAQKQLREYFRNAPELTVVEFKELLGIARKHAIDLLEYFDMQHITIRKGNQRILGEK